jgi:hypothetical protein
MLRKTYLTLAGMLVLSILVVPQSFSQQEELYDKLLSIAKENPSLEYLIPLLNETYPQGGALTMIEAEDPAAAEMINAELQRRQDGIISICEAIALDPARPAEEREAALRTEAFVQYYQTLVEMANAGAIPIGPVPGEPFVVRQFVNPLFITWWKPWPDSPREIDEKVFTAEIPIWGAAVIVKEVRGVKLELVWGPLPINPCWWWRLFHIDWALRWYYYRLVPAEFIKTISYVNTWNSSDGRPEVIKNVEQDVVVDEDLMKFWWFLTDPNAAPPDEDGNLPIMESPAKTQAIRWGEIRSGRF